MGTSSDQNIPPMGAHQLGPAFNSAMPKFVNERSQYVSPYHSDSAVDDSYHSRRRAKNGPRHPNLHKNMKQHHQNMPYVDQNGAPPGVDFNMGYNANHGQPYDRKAHKQHAFNKYKQNSGHYQSDSEILETSSVRSGSKYRGPPLQQHAMKPPPAAGMSHHERWEKDTVITDATSCKSSSFDNIPERIDIDFELDLDVASPGCCDTCFKPFVQIVVVLVSLVTPVLFAVIPRAIWIEQECSYQCISSYISLAFRMFILVIALWVIFFRRSRSTLPSIHLWRTFLFIFLGLVITISWMFFAIKIFKERLNDYDYIMNFSVSTLDCLIFLHYLAVLLLELKHMKKEFIIKVVRNTDGESRFYSIGHMSIQNCSAWVLEKYYKDFPVYNPYLMTVPGKANKGGGATQYKLYNIDGMGGTGAVGDPAAVVENSKAMIAASARNRDAGRNTRFYEEQDYERRLRKRRARLVVAVEEAFMHIKRPDVNDNEGQMNIMDAHEAAQAIFPSMARALQKYLKISRQTHCYSLHAITDHLARCITLDFTPRAFLEKYLTPGPVITSEAEQKPVQNWELVTDTIVNRGIHEGVVFQLKQENLSLVVYVAKLPRFYIKEEAIDPSQGRFVLRLQSETSV